MDLGQVNHSVSQFSDPLKKKKSVARMAAMLFSALAVILSKYLSASLDINSEISIS